MALLTLVGAAAPPMATLSLSNSSRLSFSRAESLAGASLSVSFPTTQSQPAIPRKWEARTRRSARSPPPSIPYRFPHRRRPDSTARHRPTGATDGQSPMKWSASTSSVLGRRKPSNGGSFYAGRSPSSSRSPYDSLLMLQKIFPQIQLPWRRFGIFWFWYGSRNT